MVASQMLYSITAYSLMLLCDLSDLSEILPVRAKWKLYIWLHLLSMELRQ